MPPGPRAYALLHPYERREAKGVQHLFGLDEWLELRGRARRPLAQDERSPCAASSASSAERSNPQPGVTQ